MAPYQCNAIIVCSSKNTEDSIDGQLWLKREFYSNPEIVYCLGKKTLVWLAAEPEIHWSCYLPIIKALHKMGDDSAAYRYLNKLTRELNISTEGKSIDYLLNESENCSMELSLLHKKWCQIRIETLNTELENIFFGKQEGNAYSIVSQLEVLGGFEQAQNGILPKLYQVREELINKLKQGIQTDELKMDFFNLRENYKILKNLRLFAVYQLGLENLIQSIVIDVGHINYRYGKDSGLSDANYGINPAGEIFNELQKIYYIFECLADNSFYKKLQRRSLPIPKHARPDNYDEDFIKRYFLKFLRNELCVYAEGEREAISDNQQYQYIMHFNELREFYIKIGELGTFQQLLPEVYEKLHAKEKKYNPELYKKKRREIFRDEWSARRYGDSYQKKILNGLYLNI